MHHFVVNRSHARTLVSALILIALLGITSLNAFAQATKGSLRGTVLDPNGQVVAGATVTAKNQSTGLTTSTATTGEGLYVIPELLPGKYTVTVETTAGFSKQQVTDVEVGIGQATNVPFALAVGSPTEIVTVTSSSGTELALQKDQSQISSTFETRRIAELPSNAAGSGLDTIALLAPGVIANNSGGVNTNGSGLSVNGNRARSNNFQIDGSDNNDLSVAGPANFVDNQDAVQEYQIITNNFSAQYGRNQGAVVNIVTKSGTNDFHGSLFEYHRDNAVLNSLDNIEKASGQTRPNPSLFNVFGGTIGGPVYVPRFGEGGKSYSSGKDRVFFFFSYQGIRNPATATFRSNSLGILPGEFSRLTQAFPGNGAVSAIANFSTFAIPGATFNTNIPGVGVPSAFNFGALPTGCSTRVIPVGGTAPAACAGVTYATLINPATGAPFLTGGPFDVVNLGSAAAPQLFQAAQFQRNFPTPFNETAYTIKFDARATNKDNISVRYLKQSQNFLNQLVGAASANGFQGDVIASSTNFGGNWTRTLSNSMVNDFRAVYTRIGVVFGGGNGAGIGQIPDPTAIGSTITNMTFAGVTGVSKGSSVALSTIGPSTALPQGRIGKVYQFADNFNWTRGNHSFIFGAEYKHLSEVSPFLPNYNGAFAFNSPTRLVNNAPSGLAITAGDPLISYTENDQYYFVQDDFKIKPNLTLNLGVRYEYTGQPFNILNEITTARESGSAPFFNPSLPLSIRTVPKIPADKNNFAPRVGFAYTPNFWKSILGEDATVIRGGFAIAYEPAFYNILQNVQNGAPFSVALTLPANLLPASNSPFPIPGGVPTGDVIRAQAASSGLLPLGKLNPLFLTQTQVAPNFYSPYSEQWSFGVQHQFGRRHTAEVRYVGTHGVGLFQNINANFFVGPMQNGIPNFFGTGVNMPAFPQFVPAGVTAQVCVNDPATFDNEAVCNGRILRQGSITRRDNTGQSIYHGLQSRYSGRFLKESLSLNVAYTWSKTIDNASEIFAIDIASANAQNPFCVNRCERALSQIDRPHAFSTNFIYDLPFAKEQKGLVGHLIGGWQINGVYVLTSGEPYTPGQFFNGSIYGVGNAYLTSGDRPFLGNTSVDPRKVGISQLDAALLYGTSLQNVNGFFLLNALNTTGDEIPVTPNDVHYIVNTPNAARIFGTPFGNSPRNSLRGPKLDQLNMSVFKNTKVGERVTVQFRAEAFNVLNHPNPGYGVNGAGYLPDFFVEDAGNAGAAFAEHKDIELARRVIQLGIRIVF